MDQAEGLRNMVKNQSHKTNSRLIAITSGKGGVGKSNTAVNLALFLKRQGKRVVILDADFGLANVQVMFDVVPKYTMADMMFNGKELKDIIIEGPEGVKFISGGSGIANMSKIGNSEIRKVVNELWMLEEMTDVVIIDTGAGIAPSVLEFLAASPEIILVTTPEPTSITDAYALLKALRLYPGFKKEEAKISLIANKVMSSGEGDNLYEKLNSVVKRFLDIDMEWLGCIPQDNCVSKSVMKQNPVCIMYPNSAAAKAYEQMAERVLKDTPATQSPKTGIVGFFGRMLHRNQN